MSFLYWAILFVVVGLIAMIIGAKGIAGCSMAIARVFLTIFFIIALIMLIIWFFRGCPHSGVPFV
jgi:uncharacterized membrane protein YtjA (UPF0391 family)